MEWLSTGLQWVGAERALSLLRALLLTAAGFMLGRLVSATAVRILRRHMDSQQAMLLRKVINYGLVTLFLVAALHELGFQLGVLVGAAGIVTVALGFASQTSASNLISGLFLVVERPFVVGDVIKIGDTTGEVLSIDLLSVQLRTFDNLFVRVPNETVVKSEITNFTRFPIRRLDLQIGVAYKEDIERVRRVLNTVADLNPLCLEEPKPVFIFQGFGDSAINLQFSVWTKKENFLELKNSIQIAIKETFDREGIEIPFPHVTLYTGSVTAPFPVRLEEEGNRDDNTPH